MKKSIASGVVALALATGLGFVWSLDTRAGELDDQSFVNQATQAGLAEIELGKVAQDRASNADVKTFAREMIDDHTKLNQEVKAIAEKKGLKVPTEVDESHKKIADRLSKLTGTEFDREYAKINVDEHKKALNLVKDEVKSTHDTAFRDLAQKAIPTFEHHLAMAEKLATKVSGLVPHSP